MSRNRMPHNNRMSASSALKTNDIWSKTIGHDPYAALINVSEKNTQQSEQNANLLLLIKLSNVSGSESRGNCKKCGIIGHLTFQCRNTLVVSQQEDSISSSSNDQDILTSVVGLKRSDAHLINFEPELKKLRKKDTKRKKDKSVKKRKKDKSKFKNE